ncbi:uncharacterized protein LOC106155122 [Lingula anatina]|uniref:Uncharacterized protein LOC106155122 n=1 Tax=Lingula anatina TaxID=7574 RepID=A0A1S3HGP1_LINAN|nr:uncharacterized protein LOC106155122 [Lingula anatina]|eukprot:XP_013385253.1 uncharacterized protein LOC106155122 [Lingula anatina]
MSLADASREFVRLTGLTEKHFLTVETRKSLKVLTAMFWFSLLLVVAATLPVSKDGVKREKYQAQKQAPGQERSQVGSKFHPEILNVWGHFSNTAKTLSHRKSYVDINDDDRIQAGMFSKKFDTNDLVMKGKVLIKINENTADWKEISTHKKRYQRNAVDKNTSHDENGLSTDDTLDWKEEGLINEAQTETQHEMTDKKNCEQSEDGVTTSNPACGDASTQDIPHPAVPQTPIDLSDYAKYVPRPVMPQCIHLPGYNATGIAVVSRCPAHWLDNDVRDFCEHVQHDAIFSDVPVSDFYGNTYRDVFCAQCNMVTDMEIWTKSVTCNHNPLEKEPKVHAMNLQDISRYVDEDCRVEAIQPPIQIQELIKHCDHPAPPNAQRLVRRDASNVLGMASNRFTTSFSILMNFGINGQAHILLTSTQQLTKNTNTVNELPSCTDEQIFDPVKKACFLILCQEGYVINAEKQVCEPIDAAPVDAASAVSPFKIKLSFYMSRGLIKKIETGFDRFINESVRAVSDAAGIRPDQIIDVTFGDYVNATDNLTKIDYSASREQAMTLDQFDHDYSFEGSGEPDELSDLVHKQMIFLVKPDEAEEKDTYDDMDAYIDRITAAFKRRRIMLEFHQLKFNISGGHNNVGLIDWCKDGRARVYLASNFTLIQYFDENLNLTRSGVYINVTETIYKVGEFDLTVLLQGEWDFLGPVHHNFDGYATVCEKHPRLRDTSCPKMPINVTDAKFYPNRHFKFHGKNYSLNEYQYTRDAGKLLICVPEVWRNGSEANLTSLTQYETHYKLACASEIFGAFESAESYLTVILGVTSVVAMAITLFTFLLFRQLRNLPGTNVMNLTAALLLGQAAFFSGSLIKHEELCVAVAVGTHYLFLAAFFWMNVMAFDLYKTFTTKCILPRVREKGKFFPRYMLYAWGCPALIVMACVLVDKIPFFEELDFNIGYGRVNMETSFTSNGSAAMNTAVDIQASGCWISVPTATLTVFGGPLFFICFVNAFFFGRTILSIRATMKVTKLSRRRASVSRLTGHADVMLYVRMSTFMGFTWVFGLASSVISGIVPTHTATVCYVLYTMNILFIVFNCSQGMFIFFAFICNRRVYDLYKSACRCQTSLSPWKQEAYGVNCIMPRTISNASVDSMGSKAKIIDHM